MVHLVKPGGPVPETEKRGALVERVPTLGNSKQQQPPDSHCFLFRVNTELRPTGTFSLQRTPARCQSSAGRVLGKSASSLWQFYADDLNPDHLVLCCPFFA